MADKIIDVSRYQGDIDWQQVKADGVKGAILKTVSTNYTQFGGLYIDPYFEKNYAECKRLGIPVGAYYYTYAQDKAYADRELALFKKAITGKTFELPLVVDVEDNLLKPLSASALTDLVEYAAKTIESWGCYAMVYTYLNYQNTQLDMARLEKYDLWLAAYRNVRPTAPKHSIWQYSSTGKVKGINGNVDLNHCYKDFAAIIKNAGLNGFGKTETEKTETEKQLFGKIEQLEKDLEAETEIAQARAEEIEKLTKQLEQSNRQLSAERASNEIHSKQLARCQDKLAKIKEIVGG